LPRLAAIRAGRLPESDWRVLVAFKNLHRAGMRVKHKHNGTRGAGGSRLG
jgi:hypothetical protein